MIASAIHHLESHCLEVGGDFLGPHHAAAQRTVEMRLIPDERFEISESYVRVADDFERSLQAGILELRGWPDDDDIADAGQCERLGDLHLQVPRPVARRRLEVATPAPPAAAALANRVRSPNDCSSQYESKSKEQASASHSLARSIHRVPLFRLLNTTSHMAWITPTCPSMEILVPKGSDNFCRRRNIRCATSDEAR